MKHFYLFLVIFAILTVTQGCASDEPLISTQETDVAEKYNQATSRYQVLNKQAIEQLTGLHGRSSTGVSDDLIGYLLSLSEEEIDFLCEQMNVDAYSEIIDSISVAQLDYMLSIAKAEDVQKLHLIMPEYVSRGGHSVELIEELSREIESPQVKEIAVEAAAAYDNFTSAETASYLVGSDNSYSMHVCRRNLAIDCCGLLVDIGGIGVDVYTGDAPFFILNCTATYTSILAAMKTYHRCVKFASR